MTSTMHSEKKTILLILSLLLVIGLGNFMVSPGSGISSLISQVDIAPLPERTPRPLPETRTADAPISNEAVPVPEEVSTLKKTSFFDRILRRPRTFTAVPDAIYHTDFRRGVLRSLASLHVTDVLSPDQVRFGGPAVIERMRQGNIALVKPNVFGVYFNREAGEAGIGGNLFSQEPWTGPTTITECGVGFYEVVEVDGTEYCDVIRYDFYDEADLDNSIQLALSVTEEQYCNLECTQPACKSVCEALLLGETTTEVRFRWGSVRSPFAPGTQTIDMTGQVAPADGSVSLISTIQFEASDTVTSSVDPVSWTSSLITPFTGHDGVYVQIVSAPNETVTFDTASFTQSWTMDELSAFTSPQYYSLPSGWELEVDVVSTSTTSSGTEEERLNNAYFWDAETGSCGCGSPVYTSSCIDSDGDGEGDSCIQVPGGSGESTCATDADCTQTHFACNAQEQCVEVGGPGVNQCDSDIDCREQVHNACRGRQCVTVPEPGEDECSSDNDCFGLANSRRGCVPGSFGPQCGIIGCTQAETAAGLCTDSCNSDADCGYDPIGPTGDNAISSTEQLVDFPQPTPGSEFDPPALPELGQGGSSCVAQNTQPPITESFVTGTNNTVHDAPGGTHSWLYCGTENPACAVDLLLGPCSTAIMTAISGVPVFASIDGTVTEITPDSRGGQCVVITDTNDVALNENMVVLCGVDPVVSVGDVITADQTIGDIHYATYASQMCMNAGGMGPNLHYELKINGQWVNYSWTDPFESTDSRVLWDRMTDLLLNGGCLAEGQGEYPTCSDTDGVGQDIDGDGIIESHEYFDACVIGGESDIACESATDCTREGHSQCARQQCIFVSGPGINQCGNPDDFDWDPIIAGLVACQGGSCGFPNLETPPNFDPSATYSGNPGYVQLPTSVPAGLYTRKTEGCSWGNLNAIQSIYTAAKIYATGFNVRDINKFPGPGCASHQTHADGADVDITAGCATNVNSSSFCPDEAIRLAEAFIDTGEVCRILFGTDPRSQSVRDAANAYFTQQCNYSSSSSDFMIPYSGHDDHFHVDFKDASGGC